MLTPSQILALALLGALPSACAPKSGPTAAPQPAAAPPAGAVKVTMDAARAAALQAVPGQIKEEELEQENDRWIYSFEIVPTTAAANGGIMEVNIDAGDGSIIEVIEEASEEDDKH